MDSVMVRCVRCGGEESNGDLRTIRMGCGYDMNELDIPLSEVPGPRVSTASFSIRVCRDCRAAWMRAQENWFKNCVAPVVTGTGSYIRDKGGIREMTQEEIDALSTLKKDLGQGVRSTSWTDRFTPHYIIPTKDREDSAD